MISGQAYEISKGVIPVGRRRKRRALKNNFTERKHFIRHYQKNGWMDFSELRAIDSLHNEGTNTLVMGGLG